MDKMLLVGLFGLLIFFLPGWFIYLIYIRIQYKKTDLSDPIDCQNKRREYIHARNVFIAMLVGLGVLVLIIMGSMSNM